MADKPRTVELQVRYRCGQCDTVLEEGERRCPECNKFGSKVIGIECPHCGEFIDQDDIT